MQIIFGCCKGIVLDVVSSANLLRLILFLVGWPIGGFDVDEPVTAQVTFVSSEVRNPLVDITKFWDLESIGIKYQSRDVHESVISDLKFSGTRYSVGLPWKESHVQDPLPTNYELSLKHMKGQIIKAPQQGPSIIRCMSI
jgi:hypothetical protein